MKRLVAAAVAAGVIAFTPVVAAANERVTDAALGALAGALVAGPVGLVAGGVVGYAAGPDIARGLGLKERKNPPRRKAAQVRRQRS